MQAFAVKVSMHCGYCGGLMRAYFTSMHERGNAPGLAMSFCSEKCANSFLLRDEIKTIGRHDLESIDPLAAVYQGK